MGDLFPQTQGTCYLVSEDDQKMMSGLFASPCPVYYCQKGRSKQRANNSKCMRTQ